MRWSARTWTLISLLLLGGFLMFWQMGDRRIRERRQPAPEATNATVTNGASGIRPTAAAVEAIEAAAASRTKGRYPHQLSNTKKPLGQLMRSETAVLLQNALIETAEPTGIEVPAHLRSQSDPAAYIVQARGRIDDGFRRAVAAAGGSIVSYIPNNAYLVRMGDTAAQAMRSAPRVQSVLPYEPYFKFDTNLLAHAVSQKELPAGQKINVTGFPGERGTTRTAIESTGARVLAEEPAPFGTLFTIEPAAGAFVALARLSAIQHLETWRPRVAANDFARFRMRVSTNTSQLSSNWLGLTGNNITVGINDTGVDAGHPDLTGRVTADVPATLTDTDGHGTHVAGTIASSGVNGNLGTNAAGSTTNANMRGIAYNAQLYAQPIQLNTGPVLGDNYLQTNAATQNYQGLGRTNPLVSNNSWNYLFANAYTMAAASYDAAVRDSLLETNGMQSMVYVFAAGNEGFGIDDGMGGFPDSIAAPGTGKNVITVGAIENLRFITNTIVITNMIGTNTVLTTNAIFLPLTDSSNQVASFSSRGNVGIGLEGVFGRFKPDLVAPGTFTVSTRATGWQLSNSVPTTSPIFPALDAANTNLAPFYRYESGTSMAAPAVSGVIALMQEFFEVQLSRGYSPALIKAMLINGARSANALYDFQTTNVINYQGWGLVNITNSLPANLPLGAAAPMLLLDQDPTNSVATGDSLSYTLDVPPEAVGTPLRFSLVWTDPPGNPAAAVKLVNDLDLLVEELDPGTGATNGVYLGNDFQQGAPLMNPIVPQGTNPVVLPPADIVNNVENVYVNPPIGQRYRITIRGSRVNVNAVTAHPDNTVQDFALVIATARTNLTTPFAFTQNLTTFAFRPVTELTNGIPAVRNRAGANTPLLSSTNGMTNQWSFYVFTNAPGTNAALGLTNGSNLVFLTYRPPELSRPRNREADIDMFVTTDSMITNLDPVAISAAARSVGRGGTELVVIQNAVVSSNSVYYVGIKSEDQQAAEYNLLALSTDRPLSQLDANGNIVMFGLPLGPIPDGDSQFPGEATPVLCINITQPQLLLRAIVTNTITHQLHGDLFTTLEFGTNAVVLHPHNLVGDTNSGTLTYIYDDSGRNDIPNSQPTGDGARSLRMFAGQETFGVPWIFTVTDNGTNHVGTIDGFDMLLERIQDTNTFRRFFSLQPGECTFGFVDVPVNATNLIVDISQLMPGPVDVFIRRGAFPTTNAFDKMGTVFPPGGNVSLGIFDSPPLLPPGPYFIMICNTNAFAVSGFLQFILEYGLVSRDRQTYVATSGPVMLADDALIYSPLVVSNTNAAARIAEVRVGIRVDHPRVSDLSFHLISPQGTRILLAENRGLTLASNYGFNFGPMPSNPTPANVLTNFSWVTFAESTNIAPLPVKFALPPLFQSANTNFVIFDLTNSFESPPAPLAIIATNPQGTTFDGWFVKSNYVAVISDSNIAVHGSNFLAIGGGGVSRVLPTLPDEDYLLTFEYRKLSSAATQSMTLVVPATADLNRFQTNLPFPGGTAPVFVPRMRLCPGQRVGVFATNCTVSEPSLVCRGPEGDTNMLINGLPAYGLTGQWSRHPLILDSNTAWGGPFYIGTNQFVTAPRDPGDYFLFLGENDDDFSNNSNAFNVIIEWQQCQLATLDWVLGNVTNTLVLEEYWKTNAVAFIGNPLTTNFCWLSNWNFTALVDRFELTRPISTVYYQPEEPLSLLQNEFGVGIWRLEVRDERVGSPVLTNLGALWSWYLQIQFAPSLPAVPLTNCVTFNGVVRGAEIRYFQVDVPLEAGVATNILTLGGPGPVELLYRDTGLPVGASPPDPLYPIPNTFIIDTNSPLGAPLVPGGRYFLGVRNLNPNQTNAFTLTVNFNLPLLTLVNNLSNCVIGVTNTLPANSNAIPAITNIVTPGTNMHWYKYVIFQDTNTTGVTFELTSTNSDLHLVASRALPAVNFLPTPTNFDYQSVEIAPGRERIVVLTNSYPVKLEPVLWIVGVYNVGTNDGIYNLTACQWTNSPTAPYQAAPPHSILTLSNDTAVFFGVGPTNTLNFFARAILDQTNSGVIFELCNMSGDADLLVRRSDLPSKTLYDFSDFKVGSQDEFVVLKTNVFIPHLNATNWFLTVVNREPFPVFGSIRYMVATNGVVTNCGGLTIVAPIVSPFGGAFSFSFYSIPGSQYRIEGSTDLTNWVAITNFTATQTSTRFTEPDKTLPNRVYRVRQTAP